MTAIWARRDRIIPGFVANLLAVSILLMGQLQLSISQGVVLSDLVFIVVIVWWLVAAGGDIGHRLGHRLLPPILFVFVGSLVALAPNGLPSWGVRDVALDVSTIFTFLAVFAIATQANESQWTKFRRAMIASLMIVAVLLVRSGSSELRDAGSFPNPNVAGHFAVTVTVALLYLSVSRRQRVAIGGIGAIAWAVSGSFGALLQASSMLGYFLWQRERRARSIVLAVAAVAFAAIVWLALPAGSGSSSVTFAGVSTTRLGRSSDGRFGLWLDGLSQVSETPWGAGPGAVHALGIASKELHNEYLAYLVERGPLALAGLAILVVMLWRYADPGGPARTLLIGYMAGSLFRETSHYRHLWISLAVMLALEARHRAREPGRSDISNIPSIPGRANESIKSVDGSPPI